MASLDALIETPRGLGTVVEIRPGSLVPSLSQVVAEPLGGGARVFSFERSRSPMPGQAQSTASFIQTLILPSEGETGDIAPAPQQPDAAQAATAYQATQQRDDEDAFHAALANG